MILSKSLTPLAKIIYLLDFYLHLNLFIMCVCTHMCACVHEVGSLVRLLELQAERGLLDSGGKRLSC